MPEGLCPIGLGGSADPWLLPGPSTPQGGAPRPSGPCTPHPHQPQFLPTWVGRWPGLKSSWQCQKCVPAEPRPPSPQCNRAQPDLSWRGRPGCPAPPRPPICLMVQGRALLPSAGHGGHAGGLAVGTWLEQVRAGRALPLGR